jgi:pimeloyl-ACP methyl ester carboxylesterase
MIASGRRQKFIFTSALIAIFVLAMGGVLNTNMRARYPGGGTGAYGLLSAIFQSPQGTFHQYKADGVTEISRGTTIGAGTVVLGVSFSSNVGITPLRLQVEVRPLGAAFTGSPTAASGVLLLTKSGTVVVSGLASGSYHWQARLENVVTGAVSAWQAFGGGISSSDFTVILRDPVLIVPGIAGTILQKASDGTEVWPNVGTMLTSPSDGYLDALALNAAGDAPATVGAGSAQSTVHAAGVLKAATLTAAGVTLFSDDFYGNLINAFKSDGYVEDQNLFTVPYDWRLDINKSVATLAAKVAQAIAASPTGKIAIVAHSMGGLLVKKYLAGLAAAPFLDKLVLVGVPELGAPYAYKILSYGDDLNIPILNQDEIEKIAQNMPAIYELLPSQKYIATAGDYVQDFRSAPATDARNGTLLNLANAFHQSIDGVLSTGAASSGASPGVYTITGCGKPTITGYDLYDGGVVDLERGSGDGTVPVASAAAMETGASRNYFVMSGATGIDHTGLMSDVRPVSLIKNIVGGVSALTLPQGISTSAADCDTQFGSAASSGSSSSLLSPGSETTIEFSAYGAGDLGVYDAAGDYTGVTASGTVALGIPGSDYEKLGDNTFVLVPANSTAGGSYRAVSRSAASGTFAMKVRGYRGVAIDREATYFSVSANVASGTSAAAASTTAELDFSGFGGNMDLHIKRSGGGYQSQSVVHHPDSVLAAPFSRDHRKMEWLPPQTLPR